MYWLIPLLIVLHSFVGGLISVELANNDNNRSIKVDPILPSSMRNVAFTCVSIFLFLISALLNHWRDAFHQCWLRVQSVNE